MTDPSPNQILDVVVTPSADGCAENALNAAHRERRRETRSAARERAKIEQERIEVRRELRAAGLL